MPSCATGETCSCGPKTAASVPPSQEPLVTLIDAYLAEHRRLSTPVAVFGRAHDTQSLAHIRTASSQLIPLTAPAPGEQYAFEVNFDACSGCKACVSACHSLNGLDETEAWRDVGMIFGGSAQAPYQQTVTSACHHCAEPGCLEGCPVLAYEKDPLTGIVRHLDDQCIGCQYCILKCPYDVPKYNERLGIVRKCDLCHQRLAVGEAPACVQACPTSAIRVVKVSLSTGQDEHHAADADGFLKAAPDPSYTRPTTRFRSSREIPANAIASDHAVLRPQPMHASLVCMLVLTQAGYGLLCGGFLENPAPSTSSYTGLALVLAGLLASVTHLGRPERAWRIFLGLRRSWLSREAVLLGLSAACLVPGLLAPHLPFIPQVVKALATPLVASGILSGLAGVLCSVMIYADTRRDFWSVRRGLLRMGGTTLLFLLFSMKPGLAAVLLAGKLGLELLDLRDTPGRSHAARTSARLQRGPLASWVALRMILGLTSLLLCLAAPGWIALAFLLAAELAERALFFGAVHAPKMPGMPAT